MFGPGPTGAYGSYAYAWSLCHVNLFQFRGKIARALQSEYSLSIQRNWNELRRRQDIFCFNHAFAFYKNSNIVNKCWLTTNGTNDGRNLALPDGGVGCLN